MKLACVIAFGACLIGACTADESVPARIDATDANADGIDADDTDAACTPWSSVTIPLRGGEAVVDLYEIRRLMLLRFATDGGFPRGVHQSTPAVSCCAQNWASEALCFPIVAEWEGLWATLPFAKREPFSFQYSYSGEATGATAVVTATGNLDCDATSVTFALTCTSPGGVPACELHWPSICD